MIVEGFLREFFGSINQTLASPWPSFSLWFTNTRQRVWFFLHKPLKNTSSIADNMFVETFLRWPFASAKEILIFFWPFFSVWFRNNRQIVWSFLHEHLENTVSIVYDILVEAFVIWFFATVNQTLILFWLYFLLWFINSRQSFWFFHHKPLENTASIVDNQILSWVCTDLCR